MKELDRTEFQYCIPLVLVTAQLIVPTGVPRTEDLSSHSNIYVPVPDLTARKTSLPAKGSVSTHKNKGERHLVLINYSFQ